MEVASIDKSHVPLKQWKNLAHGEVTQRVFDHVFIDCVGERFTNDAESQLLSGIWG